MGFFFFDESIQSGAGFIIGAYVYSKEKIDDQVCAALTHTGLRPGVDEFKSGAHMMSNPVQKRAREDLRGILHRTTLGLVVSPLECRHEFGREALLGFKKILTVNEFTGTAHEAFFDGGLFRSSSVALEIARATGFPAECVLHFEQDSTRVMGLQLACIFTRRD